MLEIIQSFFILFFFANSEEIIFRNRVTRSIIVIILQL